jgi:hypothetical protein
VHGKIIFITHLEERKGKRPPVRPTYRWVDNIRMDVGETGWCDVDWLRIGTSGGLL